MTEDSKDMKRVGPPPPPSYDDRMVVIVPKGLSEGDAFIVNGMPPHNNSSSSSSGRTLSTTKSYFFRHRCQCFGQDFKVFNNRNEKQYMFKGALKILGQIDLHMTEVKTGDQLCTVKRGTNVFTSGRVKIAARKRTFATISISTLFGLSIGIKLATHGSLRIAGDVKKREYRVLGPKSITGNEHIVKVTMSERMRGMIEIEVAKDDLCAPLWVACCVAIEKCVADWERRNNPRDDDMFAT